jgi:hypothetical protein
VVHGMTGYLFADPRDDKGEDFGRLLSQILETGNNPNPLEAPAALRRFTQPTFNGSVERLLEAIAAKLGDRSGIAGDEPVAPAAS